MTAHRQTSRQPTSRDRALQVDGNGPEWRGEYSAPTPDTDVAYAAGAEAMREACAEFVRTWVRVCEHDAGSMPPMVLTLASRVARLPLPPAPESTS